MYREEKVSLDKSTYSLMQKRLEKLSLLEVAGVERWEYYHETLKNWLFVDRLDRALEEAVADIEDFLTEAEIDQPAGSGCGYAISFDDTELKKILINFSDRYKAIELEGP